MNVDESLKLAVARHKAGQLPEAEALYRHILSETPNHVDALHLLGVLSSQTGRADAAIDLIQRALLQNPGAFQMHLNLGVALNEAGKTEEAIATFNRALTLSPEEPRVLCNLSYALWKADRPREAISAAQRALAKVPDYPEAHNNLGNALQADGQLAQAVVHFQRALALRPNVAETHANLASALTDLGKFDEAISSAERAIAIKPSLAIAHNNLGAALLKKKKLADAAIALRQAVKLRPTYAEAWYNLGLALANDYDYSSAAEAWQHAVENKPDHVVADSNRIFLLHYDPKQTSQSILKEHKAWNDRHAQTLTAQAKPHTNDRSPDRRLRIGYVSPDFRNHVVGWFIWPLLNGHHRDQFEIFCYSDVAAPDAMTERLKPLAHQWRNVVDAEDDQLAEIIRSDGIDVLVDLSGHTDGNRLLTFARKPAPIQFTYLGYPGTTGLSAMDYRFSDPHLDPPKTVLKNYSEQTLRLPLSYWCFAPLNPVPEIAPAPAIANGYVTYGCLHNFGKVTNEALDLWMRLLASEPDSHLLLNCEGEHHRRRVHDLAAAQKIDANRLEFVARRPWDEYVRTFQRIDVALDTFPYGGAVSICDALWMGVPVITLSGRTVAGRGGRSILNNAGLPELVAITPEEYVKLATDWKKLIELRPTMRQKLSASPLMDAARFTNDVEAAYRKTWRSWCAK